jgi:hypothetical protein
MRKGSVEARRHAKIRCPLRHGLASGSLVTLGGLDLDVGPEPQFAAQARGLLERWNGLAVSRVQPREYGVRSAGDAATAVRRALERLVVNQHRRAVAREHDVELDALEPERRAEPDCAQRVLRRERAAAAVREDLRTRPAHASMRLPLAGSK